MTTLAALILLAAGAAMLAAMYYARMAGRYAWQALQASIDTKAAIIAWWEEIRPPFVPGDDLNPPDAAKDMAAALAERRAGEPQHWTAGGK